MLALRKATGEDWEFLVELRRETMRPHVERSGRAYDEEAQSRRLSYKYDCAEIVQYDGRDIGQLKVDRSEQPWVLIQIQIAPEFQRRGLGEELLRRLLAEAEEQRASIQLSVLRANPARRLYERLAFVVVAEKEHAFLMLYTAATGEQRL
jgi:GNAT superfamily N-acetyltransferase